MKKRRTRQHVIEDLGFNFVERQVLLEGYVIEKHIFDYGYDGGIVTFDENGELENGYIMFQLKSTDNIRFDEKRNALAFDLSKRDLETWLLDTAPVVLLLYDAQIHRAYWVELQAYFRQNRIDLKNVNKFIRVFLPIENVWGSASIQQLRAFKNTLKVSK
jgi:hypothetical protein